MAEEYSAGTLSADLTVDTTGLTQGFQDANDQLDKLDRAVDDAVKSMTQGFQHASEGVKDTDEAVQHTEESVDHLKEAVEALGLFEVFEVGKEVAMEAVNAFDQNTRSLRNMNMLVDATDSEKFQEMAEGLSAISRNSVATEESTIALASRFGLADSSIAELLPRVNDFAAATGKDLPQAMQAFAIAVSSGEAAPRRLGIALDEQQQAAFKAADSTERVGILMEALGKYAGGAQADLETASGALAHMHNANEELLSSFGSLIDKPLAAFFNAIATAATALTNAINGLSPMTKEIDGNIAAILGALTSGVIAVTAFSKAFSVLSGILGPMTELLPTLTGGVAGLGTAFSALIAPLAAGAIALGAVAAAYGSIKNAMEGKFSDGVFATLKDGFMRAVNDAKAAINEITNDVSEKLEGEEGGFKGAVGSKAGINFGASDGSTPFDALNQSLAKSKQALDDETAARDEQNQQMIVGLNDWEAGLDATFKQAPETQKALQSMTDAFAKAADAYNKKADEEIAEAQKEQAAHDLREQQQAQQRQNQAYESTGGAIFNAFAGIDESDTQDQRTAKIGSLSTGAKVGASIVGGAVQSAGVAGQVGTGIAGAAMGNPAGLAQAGLAILQQSKSFQTIMDAFNKVIGGIVKVIDPIVGILGKILVPVLNALTAVLELVAKVIIDGVVNPLIDLWNGIIDFIDDALGWLGVDLSGYKAAEMSDSEADDATSTDNTTQDNTNATQANTKALDMASQNIPQGFKVALDAFNAYNGQAAAPIAQTEGTWLHGGNATQQYVDQLKSGQASMGSLATGGVLGSSYTDANGNVVSYGINGKVTTAPTTQSKFALPATSNTAVSSSVSNSSSNSVVIQSVQVQAATADLLGEMQKMLKMKGYLSSGTNLMGATARTQYGSA